MTDVSSSARYSPPSGGLVGTSHYADCAIAVGSKATGDSPTPDTNRPLVPPGGLLPFTNSNVSTRDVGPFSDTYGVMHPSLHSKHPACWSGLALSHQDRALLMAHIRHRRQADIAAELGVSDRHLRRLARALVDRLGVPTVHAAVVVAVASGALPLSPRTAVGLHPDQRLVSRINEDRAGDHQKGGGWRSPY